MIVCLKPFLGLTIKLVYILIACAFAGVWSLCPEIGNPAFLPCSCQSIGSSTELPTAQLLLLDCDRVVLPTSSDPPLLPPNVVAFRQRGAGLQSVGGRPLFVGRGSEVDSGDNKTQIRVQRLDLSDNRVARVTLGAFDGFHDTLRDLNLDGNRLGDHLNPVFTSDELQKLEGLHVLHLAHNGLRALDDQLLRKMKTLQELHLEGNELATIPSSPLRSLSNLQELHLEDNAIGVIASGAFAPLSTLSLLNLSNNAIGTVQSGAFHGLKGLAFLLLSTNQLRMLNNTALEGMPNLEVLSLSDNLLDEVPTQELARLPRLRSLLLSANRIRILNSRTLQGLASLEFLDLSRNNILEITPGTFSSQSLLHELHLDANTLRRLADNALEGLESLEVLAIDDNAILSLPTTALSLLPQLHVLSLDFNRIAAFSATFLKGLSKLHEFSMRYNLIREIPIDTFSIFQNLQVLDLHGNFLEKLPPSALAAMKESLVLMDLGDNRLAELDALMLPAIETLRLDHNNLTFIPPQHLENLKKLTVFDISANHLVALAPNTFHSLEKLHTLLLQDNHLSEIPLGTLANLNVVYLDLSNNRIRELPEGTFVNLPLLESLNLSANIIQTMKKGAFDNLASLIDLDLSGNRLSTFKGDFFRGVSALRKLDLSGNLLTYFFPDTFIVHPLLTSLDLSDNRLSFLPPELVRSAYNLGFLDLHSNTLQEIDDDTFSNLTKLHWLDLSHNSLQTIAERAFFNSSQLQNINVSHNSIEVLPTKLFQGLRRLLFDASHNNLSSLPDEIFERVYVSRVEHINLAFNRFTEIPSKALQKHSFFLEELNMASNFIRDIPLSSNVLINVKHLDMSNNPLSQQARNAILSEPKTVRVLNLAGTGVHQVPLLETPFLRILNLSSNAITQFDENAFQRATHLQQLDIAKNQLGSLHPGLVSAWTKLEELQVLDLSHNPIRGILGGDFHKLSQLKSLHINNMTALARFEAEALQDLNHLQDLQMTGYPILHFLDWNSILQSVPRPLRSLAVEIKEAVLSSQLRHAFSARLESLVVTGKNLESVSADAFVGITGLNVGISLKDTLLTTLVPSAFQPLPASTRLQLAIVHSQMTTLAPQFMNFLDERRARIKLHGLHTNPIACDCHLRPMQRWVKDRTRRGSLDFADLTCAQPPDLQGRFVLEVPEAQLVCTKPTTTTTTTTMPSTIAESTTFEDNLNHLTLNTEEELEVVYEAPAPPAPPKEGRITTLNTMDSVIIGVVVGVVAFVCLLIVIICVVKLRHNRPAPHTVPGCPSQCTCMKPNGPPMCQCSPNYPPHPPHGMGTLSVKAMPITRGGPYPNPPYYVTYPESEHDHR